MYSKGVLMHPELLNNPLFLRYYRQWQEDPSSIVFAPIAEFFLKYGMVDDAYKVCREGLTRHPNLVSGRIVMAKVHLKRGNWEEADDELRRALAIMPNNKLACELKEEIASFRDGDRAMHTMPSQEYIPPLPSHEISPDNKLETHRPWQTVTMARIFAKQGHIDQARNIYESILRFDPANDVAREELTSLMSTRS